MNNIRGDMDMIMQNYDHTPPCNSTVGLAALDRSELSDWVEQITRQLIDDDVAAPADSPASEDSFVISASDLRPRKVPRRNDSFFSDQPNDESLESDNLRALSLMALLFQSAVAVSVESLDHARDTLLEIAECASPHAPSCAERVVAYFAQAMTCRVVSSGVGIYGPACSLRHAPMVNYQNALLHGAFQAYNGVSPFVKFAHFTSNQAILEAFHGRARVHVVDLDVMQGLQWPALFHILATRAEGPPEHVRLTALGPSPDILSRTGRHLAGFAKRLGISFEFNPITRRPDSDIDVSAFRLRRGETLAVHWLRHCLYDATGSDRAAMALVEKLRPRIFTLVEPDVLSHGGSFLDRFVGALHYYSTVFDSLAGCVDEESRHVVESGLLYREICNVLAVGGPGRSGAEKFASWRKELEGSGGFAAVAMSGSAVAQARLIVNMPPGGMGGGYSLAEEEGCIRVGWKGTSLYTASAWACTHQHPSFHFDHLITS